MAESDSIEAARKVLMASLKKSREIESGLVELNKPTNRLEEMDQRLLSLESGIRDVGQKSNLFRVGTLIDRVVGPVSSVIKVFDTVLELESSLSSANLRSDLFIYLSIVKKLQEALKFLTGNCNLVIPWLKDVAEFLEEEDGFASQECYFSKLKKCLRIVEKMQAMEKHFHLDDGGPLNGAFDQLFCEFRHLLTENTYPFHGNHETSLPLPLPVISKLQAIVGILASVNNNKLANCISTYIHVRSSNVRATFQALGLDYLEIRLSEIDSAQGVEDYIYHWAEHLEFAVKRVLELEFRLCNHVFQDSEPDVWLDCFAEVCAKSRFLDFIKFGNSITKSKKEAIKLFKLLDIFRTLNQLRMDFNRLFGGKHCIEIQTQTRDLIREVVNGACQIFWELSVQVELQRRTSPPLDGSVPRLVSFVTEYCNLLLEEDYKSTLTQILEINKSWNSSNYNNNKNSHGEIIISIPLVVCEEVSQIMKSLQLNLETWAKTYPDVSQSNLFMMNNHGFFCKNVKGTKLGDFMGDSWMRGHENYTEYYAAIYLRESWEKIAGFLTSNSDDLMEEEAVEQRIHTFSHAFDEMCKKQSGWMVSDKGLRLKVCQRAEQIVITAYSAYIENNIAHRPERKPNSQCLRYNAESMQKMINSVFQVQVGRNNTKYSCSKCTDLIGKEIRNGVAVTDHFSTTPAAA